MGSLQTVQPQSQPGKRGEKVLERTSQANKLILKTFLVMQRTKKSSSAFLPAKYQPIASYTSGKKFISAM